MTGSLMLEFKNAGLRESFVVRESTGGGNPRSRQVAQLPVFKVPIRISKGACQENSVVR